MSAQIRQYETREAATAAVARAVEAAVTAAVDAGRRALLCLSGGTSPVALYRSLATRDALPWAQTDVTLSDERWVGVDDEQSNEGLLRRELLQGAAAAATLHGLYRAGQTPEAAVPALARDLDVIDRPFDYCLLGMGADGHTASLFPDARDLPALLAAGAPVAAVHVPRLSMPRMTLTPTRLLHARQIGLLVFGDEKLIVLERAVRGEDPAELPVRCVLNQTGVPVTCHWAP